MPREKTRIAVGYARVSTSEQALEGVSLSDQVSRIKALVVAKGNMKLADTFDKEGLCEGGIFIDDGYTGKNLERPGIAQIMELADKGKIDDVIVIRIDRMARKMLDFLSIIDMFNKKGIGFHSIAETLDSTTAPGRLVMSILAAIAEYERELIVERIKEALQWKKENDERLGTPLYGYRVVRKTKSGPGELVENPDEIKVLEEIRECRQKGWSLSAIAKYLNNQGHKTKRRGTKKQDSQWHASTVRYIVHNPKYAAFWETKPEEQSLNNEG